MGGAYALGAPAYALGAAGSALGVPAPAGVVMAGSAGTAAGGAGAAAGGVASLLGLVFATLGILALAWWASRWVGLHGAPPASGQGGGLFRVLGQLPLGRNERLALVRFQDRCLLLGVTEHSITLLRELDAEESAAYLSEAKEPPGFAEILGGILKNREGGILKKRERGDSAPQERDWDGEE